MWQRNWILSGRKQFLINQEDCPKVYLNKRVYNVLTAVGQTADVFNWWKGPIGYLLMDCHIAVYGDGYDATRANQANKGKEKRLSLSSDHCFYCGYF